jgi:hypothetical protein
MIDAFVLVLFSYFPAAVMLMTAIADSNSVLAAVVPIAVVSVGQIPAAMPAAAIVPAAIPIATVVPAVVVPAVVVLAPVVLAPIFLAPIVLAAAVLVTGVPAAIAPSMLVPATVVPSTVVFATVVPSMVVPATVVPAMVIFATVVPSLVPSAIVAALGNPGGPTVVPASVPLVMICGNVPYSLGVTKPRCRTDSVCRSGGQCTSFDCLPDQITGLGARCSLSIELDLADLIGLDDWLRKLHPQL